MAKLVATPLTAERAHQIMSRIRQMEGWFYPREVGASYAEALTLAQAHKIETRLEHGGHFCCHRIGGEVEAWNGSHPVGTEVILTEDDGSETRTTTRSEAWYLGHGEAVVKVKGRAGGYLLGRIRPA